MASVMPVGIMFLSSKKGFQLIYRKELPRLTADMTGKTSSKLGSWGRMLLKLLNYLSLLQTVKGKEA